MDERIKKALDFSSYRITLFNTKENIRTKVDSMLLHAVNGGIFQVNTDLISFVKAVIDMEKDSVVLIDNNGNPIEIIDPKKFLDDIFDRYFQATNFYHSEYTKLKKARSVKDQFIELFENDEEK